MTGLFPFSHPKDCTQEVTSFKATHTQQWILFPRTRKIFQQERTEAWHVWGPLAKRSRNRKVQGTSQGPGLGANGWTITLWKQLEGYWRRMEPSWPQLHEGQTRGNGVELKRGLTKGVLKRWRAYERASCPVFSHPYIFSCSSQSPESRLSELQALQSFLEDWKLVELSCSSAWTRNLIKRFYFSRR